MSPSNRDTTMIGYVLGIVGTVMGGLAAVGILLVCLFYGALIVAAIAGSPPPSGY